MLFCDGRGHRLNGGVLPSFSYLRSSKHFVDAMVFPYTGQVLPLPVSNFFSFSSHHADFPRSMPVLLTKIEGKGNGIKTVIPNMSDVAKALSRPPSCKHLSRGDVFF